MSALASELDAVLVARGLTLDAIKACVKLAVKSELADREQRVYLSRSQLAAQLGCSAKALAMRLARGSSLRAIARQLDGKEVWLVSEVDALLAGGK